MTNRSFVNNLALENRIRTGRFSAALGATDVRIRQFNQVIAANRIDLDALAKEEPPHHLAL